MITKLIKLVLGRKVTPFQFLPDPNFLPNYDVPSFGIYVHIPFCKSLCLFCPYYKTTHNQSLDDPFVNALLKEIELVAKYLGPEQRKITSVYFGGGSPAILLKFIFIIMDAIRSHFVISENIGLELHPRDVTDEVLVELKRAGVTMISLGVQSFQKQQLDAIGRSDILPLDALKRIAHYGFIALDVDLIFGIPGQDADSLELDFLTAIENGATQVSTYPFIDFSYANNYKKPLGHKEKKLLLGRLIEVSERVGFSRTSVWTFGKMGTPKYTSITRDNFIGFGPSATSLGLRDFKINTFSIEAYIDSVQKDIIPTALRMKFSDRTRSLYWLFWSSYNGAILQKTYGELFGRSLKKDFGIFLWLGEILGLLVKHAKEESWNLTKKGSYLFHRIEQIYTHQYIDKTWRSSLITPWPDKIELD